MSNYTEGEMILTIKVEDTFVVDVEQGQEVRSFVTGVPTENSTLVTEIELPLTYSDTLMWENDMMIMRKLRKRSLSRRNLQFIKFVITNMFHSNIMIKLQQPTLRTKFQRRDNMTDILISPSHSIDYRVVHMPPLCAGVLMNSLRESEGVKVL